MEHFKPFLMFAITSTNIACTDKSQIASDIENTQTHLSEEPEIGQSAIDLSEVVAETTSKEKEKTRPKKNYEHKNKKNKTENSDQEGSSVNTVLNYLENRRERKKEPIDLIFQGYAEILKQFSPRRQAYTKLKIAEIITQQELQHQEELLLHQTPQSRPDSAVSTWITASRAHSTSRSSLASPPLPSPLDSRALSASQSSLVSPPATSPLESEHFHFQLGNASSFFGIYDPNITT